MYRTWIITAHTFKEAVFQPVYTLLIIFGAAVIGVFGALPFFTFGEDTMMFKTVCLDIILVFVLVGTLFVTSRSIYEEIEDRTMLTLMSKPVRRWEVMLGKYLGIVLAALLATVALGVVMGLGLWLRIPVDYQIRATAIDDIALRELYEHRIMHLSGLVPSLVLAWMQVSVLAAIGVAISTRFSLVVNLPAVLLIYVAGNLARFAPIWQEADATALTQALVGVSYLFPFLHIFDFRQEAILSPIALAGTRFAEAGDAVSLTFIWTGVAAAAVYAAAYSAFALAAGLFFFRNRELGGSEG